MNESGRQPNGNLETSILWEFRNAIGEDLELLAALHDRELDLVAVKQLVDLEFPTGLGLRLRKDDAVAAQRKMQAAVAGLQPASDTAFLDELAVDFADIYLNHRVRAAPTGSVWLDKDHLVRQQPMFQVREVYRKRGLKVVDERMRPDDHLVTELRFLAHLFTHCDDSEALGEAADFLDRHLFPWVGSFSDTVATRCESEFYAALALLTASFLDELRDVLAGWLEEPRPPLEDAEIGGDDSGVPETALPVNNPLSSPSW